MWEINIPGQLLGNGTAALFDCFILWIDKKRPAYAGYVNACMIIKFLILCNDEQIFQEKGDVFRFSPVEISLMTFPFAAFM